MTRFFQYCTVIGISILLLACSKPDYEKSGVRLGNDAPVSMRSLADMMMLPPQDRLSNYSDQGYLRVLAYQTMDGLKVPGFAENYEEGFSDKLIESVGVELAPGMGDQILNDDHLKLQRYFIDYAGRYNQLLVDHVAAISLAKHNASITTK